MDLQAQGLVEISEVLQKEVQDEENDFPGQEGDAPISSQSLRARKSFQQTLFINKINGDFLQMRIRIIITYP